MLRSTTTYITDKISRFLAITLKNPHPLSRYRPLCALTLVASLLNPQTPECLASEIVAAIAGVDESDDRARPGLMLHVGVTPEYFARAYYFGRTQGVVTEDTALLSGGYRFALFNKASGFTAGIGGSLLREATTIKAEALPADATEDDVSANYNIGMMFSLNWTPIPGPVVFNIGWDSHLYLAGTAGLFLATARKQFISIGSGVAW